MAWVQARSSHSEIEVPFSAYPFDYAIDCRSNGEFFGRWAHDPKRIVVITDHRVSPTFFTPDRNNLIVINLVSNLIDHEALFFHPAPVPGDAAHAVPMARLTCPS
jgi:hypothetical protein